MSDHMIEVRELTKQYGNHMAVNHVSFEVARGDIVGLLGPNGAGKSSILRILSCFMPATAGTVKIGGFDVYYQADEVRRRIGYMPENNPLHLEMRVREYLRFRGRLKGLSAPKTGERVEVVLEQCGLKDVQKRIIGQLSKGYKQRVGLADALVHEPDLIILDEPTIGLDPNQLRSVRDLIKSLGGSQTVLLSTHILPEVEATCNRVVILSRGDVMASGKTEDLHKTMLSPGPVTAEIAADPKEIRDALAQVEEIESGEITRLEGEEVYCLCKLSPSGQADLRPILFELVKERGWALRELTRERRTLEDIFVKATLGDGGQN